MWLRWRMGDRGLPPGQRPRQLPLPFLSRRLRRERQFKRAILAVTACALGLAALTPIARHRLARARTEVPAYLARTFFGLEPDHAEIEAVRALERSRDTSRVQGEFVRQFKTAPAPLARLLEAGGMDPPQAVIRWGNFDRMLVLSGKVFQADDTGRSYTLKPNVRSIWIRTLEPPKGISGLFLYLIPDQPEVRAALAGTGGIPIEDSVQTTNSWGCRGPEPDPEAPLRVLVLGDSYMQGMLIGDESTPPFQLAGELEKRTGKRVSILNTGVLGYSPEQYYYSMIAMFARFRPHAVVVGLCANDAGDPHEAIQRGKGDWAEAKHWLGRIEQFCLAHENMARLFVPAPADMQVTGRRRSGNYPGRFADVLEHAGKYYLDPTDAFIDEDIRLKVEMKRMGMAIGISPLFNGRYSDGHFSAEGSRVWARVVADRLARLLELDPI